MTVNLDHINCIVSPQKIKKREAFTSLIENMELILMIGFLVKVECEEEPEKAVKKSFAPTG